jgi:hypothetical protein
MRRQSCCWWWQKMTASRMYECGVGGKGEGARVENPVDNHSQPPTPSTPLPPTKEYLNTAAAMYVGGASLSSGVVVGGGARSVHTPRFMLHDQEQTLTWAVRGRFKDSGIFVSMLVVLFSPGVAAPQRTEVFAIGTSGSRSSKGGRANGTTARARRQRGCSEALPPHSPPGSGVWCRGVAVSRQLLLFTSAKRRVSSNSS